MKNKLLDILNMKIDVSDNELRYIFDETLSHRFDININTEYKFFYDEFFNHILDDTNKRFNIKKDKKELFISILLQHMFSKQFNNLKFPENNIEVRQQLRLRKLKKIQDEM